MACFLVSAAEALVVTAVEKHEENVEAAKEITHEEASAVKIPLSKKLSWLKYMLWGGVVLLLFEHIWHGEVVPWFPFLTAMSDQAEAMQMLKEMATVGVCMALLITVVWFAVCKAADAIVKRSAENAQELNA